MFPTGSIVPGRGKFMKEDNDSQILLPYIPDREAEIIVSGEHDLINREIIDRLESEIVVLDKEFRVILMNRAAEAAWGVSLDDIKGLNFLKLKLELRSRELFSGLEQVVKKRTTLNIKELHYIAEQRRLVDLSYMPLLDKNNAVRGIISVGKNSSFGTHNAGTVEKKSLIHDVVKNQLKELEAHNKQYSQQVDKLSSELSKKEKEVKYLQRQLEEKHSFHAFIGKNHNMQRVYEVIERVALFDSTVLILGETGTGKELAASAIHYSSPRKLNPFVAVNCAAMPETLLESELFGHVKGSFTGALRDRKGKFELASSGTLFLDEIGDISASTQVKLLRAIQEKEIERVGDEKKIKVDIRIIAATNQNLEKLIEEGKFRKDLYYRLNVVPLNLPALRNRKDDIPLLVSSFIEKLNKRLGKNISGISPYALRKLMRHTWPGNVRELEGVIERAIIMSGKHIDDVDVPVQTEPPMLMLPDNTVNIKPYEDVLEFIEGYEKEYFIAVFAEFKGKIGEIASFTGLSRRTILNKMKKFNIEKGSFQNNGG